MQRFWVQSFPDPGRRRIIKWRPADRVGYETKLTPSLSRPVNDAQLNLTASTASRAKLVTSEVHPATARDNGLSVSLGRECLTIP